MNKILRIVINTLIDSFETFVMFIMVICLSMPVVFDCVETKDIKRVKFKRFRSD